MFTGVWLVMWESMCSNMSTKLTKSLLVGWFIVWLCFPIMYTHRLMLKVGPHVFAYISRVQCSHHRITMEISNIFSSYIIIVHVLARAFPWYAHNLPTIAVSSSVRTWPFGNLTVAAVAAVGALVDQNRSGCALNAKMCSENPLVYGLHSQGYPVVSGMHQRIVGHSIIATRFFFWSR